MEERPTEEVKVSESTINKYKRAFGLQNEEGVVNANQLDALPSLLYNAYAGMMLDLLQNGSIDDAIFARDQLKEMGYDGF